MIGGAVKVLPVGVAPHPAGALHCDPDRESRAVPGDLANQLSCTRLVPPHVAGVFVAVVVGVAVGDGASVLLGDGVGVLLGEAVCACAPTVTLNVSAKAARVPSTFNRLEVRIAVSVQGEPENFLPSPVPSSNTDSCCRVGPC